MLENTNPNMMVQKPELVEALAEVLGNNVVMYFKAHGHHWNVTGRDFSQFHDFFEEIYQDLFAQFDPVAEDMRKLGSVAPYRLSELADLSQMQDMDCGSDAILMVQDLLAANNVLIQSVNDAFNIASDLDEQGIADYLAGRDDMHKKWRWQLTAYLSPTEADSLGKSDAVQSIVIGDTEEVTPMVEQLMKDADGCPICGYGECTCPGSDGGACLCSEICPCPHCHIIMAAGSKPAPKKDRIYGSKKNAPGSAAGGKSITFSAKIENALRNKVEEHNKNASPGRKATLPMLKAVYRRGSGAFSSSHRPGKTRDQWAMARVNAFLKLLRSGRPSNPNYKQDNDLLPKAHPKSSRGEASLIQHELLEVALKSADQYGSPEHAIYSMAEYTGLGYEVIPALRGAWLRGVRDGDVPFQRAYDLATNLYNSKDADLLPKKRRIASGD
jgi:starvation-inducible DNA-binding protein